MAITNIIVLLITTKKKCHENNENNFFISIYLISLMVDISKQHTFTEKVHGSKYLIIFVHYILFDVLNTVNKMVVRISLLQFAHELSSYIIEENDVLEAKNKYQVKFKKSQKI